MLRRHLLQALGASTLAVGSAGVLAAPPAQDVRFLLVFLRGGYDCASLLVPTGSSFITSRGPTSPLPAQGSRAAPCPHARLGPAPCAGGLDAAAVPAGPAGVCALCGYRRSLAQPLRHARQHGTGPARGWATRLPLRLSEPAGGRAKPTHWCQRPATATHGLHQHPAPGAARRGRCAQHLAQRRRWPGRRGCTAGPAHRIHVPRHRIGHAGGRGLCHTR